MVQRFDIIAVFKLATDKILNINLLPMIVCTDFKLLYDCLMKRDSTQKKLHMIDLICL